MPQGGGLERPLRLEIGPDGALYIVDFGVFDVSPKPKDEATKMAFASTGVIWKVSRAEQAAGTQKNGPEQAASAQAPQDVPADLYAEWAGDDGELTVAEWDAAIDARLGEQAVHLVAAEWDDDGNGVISRKEYQEATAHSQLFAQSAGEKAAAGAEAEARQQAGQQKQMGGAPAGQAADQAATPPEAPSITIGSPKIEGETIAIPEARVATDSFLVIHALEDGQMAPQAAGHAALKAGVNRNVRVTLDPPPQPGTSYAAMLHEDTGEKGTYEFGPGSTEVDRPLMRNEKPVVERFTVE